jgi:hypothetical protein
MKYFTPELLKHFNSLNEDIADAADAESEQAITAYKKHLDKIQEKLPENVRRLLSKFYLHDARVITLALGEGVFSIFLRLEAQRGVFLMIRYVLTGKLRFIRNWPPSEAGPPLEWLYDEIGIRRKRRTTVFTHSILFTDGRELQLEFSDLQLETYQIVVSPKVNVPRGETDELESLVTTIPLVRSSRRKRSASRC